MKEPVGRVYVLTNPRMQGLVKIGFTLGTVEGRAKELDATGTPEPFEIAYQVEVRGPQILERLAHSQLAGHRVRNSREFFEVDIVEAILCVRSLAGERLDEECHPRFLEMVDESARRGAEDSKKQKNADKVRRFEEIDRGARDLQDRKKRLKIELQELQAKFDSSPPLIQLKRIEVHGELPLLLLSISSLILSMMALTAQIYLLAGLFIILAPVLFILYRRVKASAQIKNANNFAVLRLEREIFNLKFDLEKLERQKIRVPPDLCEFIPVNPIIVDEQGFEPGARVDTRRRA